MQSKFQDFNGTFSNYREYRYELAKFLNKCGLKEKDLNHPRLGDVIWLINLAVDHWDKFTNRQKKQLESLYKIAYYKKQAIRQEHISKYNNLIKA